MFRITAGTAPGLVHTETITVNVVDPDAVEEDAPEAAPLTWSRDLQGGWNVVAWSGDDADPAGVVAGTNITAIYNWDGATFTWYFPGDTAGIPNTLGELSTGEGYFVFVDDGAADDAADDAADADADATTPVTTLATTLATKTPDNLSVSVPLSRPRHAGVGERGGPGSTRNGQPARS